MQIALVDVGLPNINGIEVTRQVKAVSPATFVVVMSNYEGTTNQMQALAAGADVCIIKRRLYRDLLPTLSTL